VLEKTVEGYRELVERLEEDLEKTEVLNTMKESKSWRRREILCYKRSSS